MKIYTYAKWRTPTCHRNTKQAVETTNPVNINYKDKYKSRINTNHFK